MKIIFDPTKNSINIAKHAVPLTLASELDWDNALIWPDLRSDYGEQRMVGLALLDSRLYCVVFTERGESRRIISLRKANAREVKRYVAED
ncbi:MAG: BrnT family toxin [Methylomonas sp.]